VKYLFDIELTNFAEQEAIAGDAGRFDMMAKIKGDDVFCRMLIEHFRTRHILFEFKNYEDELKPNLIHISEKYLYPTALRGTAIIISPRGFSPQAVVACHGALRETGRLIIDLPVASLCRMLTSKDEGTPGGTSMEAVLDGLLQGVGR
jgi:hypothetical protein